MITEKYKLFITIFELWHKYYLSGLTPGRRCRYEACNIFSGDKKIIYKPFKSYYISVLRGLIRSITEA